MVSINRVIKCSSCNKDLNLGITTEIGMTDMTLQGKCNYCGNSLQVNFAVVTSNEANEQKTDITQQIESFDLDENLFGSDLPSDAIKDLIE